MSEEQAEYIVKTQEDRMKEVAAEGKHIVDANNMVDMDTFFKNYNEDMTEEEMKVRYAGMYGKIGDKAIPKQRLKRIWEEFLHTERRDFIIKHNTISVDDIIRIGIDKFVQTLGWKVRSDVSSWRRNVVRVGICPECDDQFIPLMFQTNQGLCNHCRPNFSIKAIKRFIEYVVTVNDRYQHAHHDALMDFYIMFHNDANFRKLFIKDSESANEMETREFEVPDWFKEVQEKEEARLQQRLVDMVEQQDE